MNADVSHRGFGAVFALFLGLAVVVSVAPRVSWYAHWAEHPGEYLADGVPVSAADSYYFFRMARELREGRFDEGGVDRLRDYPDGRTYGRPPALSRAMARVASWTGDDVYRAGIWVTLALSALFIFPLGAFCLRLGQPLAGLLGGLLAAASPFYFFRTSAVRVDTDGGNQFALWLTAALMAGIAPSRGLRGNALRAVGAGVAVAGFCWWYDRRGLWLVYLASFGLLVALARLGGRRAALLFGLFALCSNPLNLPEAAVNLRSVAAEYLFAGADSASRDGPFAFGTIVREVEELRPRPRAAILAGVLHPPWLAAVGLAGLALFAGAHWRAMPALLPILGLSAWALVGGVQRLGMYLAPLVGIGLGFLVDAAAKPLLARLPERAARQREVLACAAAFPVFALLLGGTAYRATPRPAVSAALLASLGGLSRELPHGTPVAHSWSFGYLLADAGFATYNDGEAPDPVIEQLLSRGLTSADPRELHAILRAASTQPRAELARRVRGADGYASALAAMAADAPPAVPAPHLLFSERSLSEFSEYFYKGQWDFAAGVGRRNGFDQRRCASGAPGVLLCRKRGQPELVVDVEAGLVAGRFPLRRFIAVREGAVRSERDYGNAGGRTAVLLEGEGDRQRILFMDDEVYRSNLTQMYLLGRFDPALFEPVRNDFPAARVYRLRAGG